MSVNSLNVDVLNEDICCICHDSLDAHPTYTLPECKHTFHTHCIVTWFRHKGSIDFSSGLMYAANSELRDGKCPLCGNRGVNNKCNSRINKPYYSNYDKERFNQNKKYLKKSDASKQMQTLQKKLTNAEKIYDDINKKYTEFKKSIKNKEVDYDKTNKILADYRREKWNKYHKLNMIKKTIANLPIIPLIIPIPLDIN